MRKAGVALGVSLAVHVAVAGVLVGPSLLRSKGRPTLSGETFEVPAPPTEEAELASASPSPETHADEKPEPTADHEPVLRSKPAPRPSREGRPSGGRSTGTPEGSPGGSATQTLYGAVGDRSATDLANAFTRGFPQAASADPVWRTAPIGPAGEATITLTIDESGHLVDTKIGGSPSPALASAIRKTLALIGGRVFVAQGRTTKLLLTATISADTIRDGLHGDVFAIGGSYAGTEGNAFFALAIGRRIDLRVRAR